MHRAARRMLMTRRGGYGAGSSPGAPMGGGGYGDGPGGSTLDSQTVHTGGGYDDGGVFSIDRSGFGQLTPDMERQLAWMVQGEVGLNAPIDQQIIQAETAFNRAAARGQPLSTVLQPINNHAGIPGYYASDTYRGSGPSQAQVDQFRENVLKPVLGGSNMGYQRFGFVPTGNASDLSGNPFASRRAQTGVYANSAWYGQPSKSEMYVVERPDAAWAQALAEGKPPPTQVATATPSAGGVGTLTSGVPTTPSAAAQGASTPNPQTAGLLSNLLGGNDAMGGNPMMGMAGNLLNQQAPVPQLNLPQPVHPNLNPMVLQQQQALLHGILNPQFRGLMG